MTCESLAPGAPRPSGDANASAAPRDDEKLLDLVRSRNEVVALRSSPGGGGELRLQVSRRNVLFEVVARFEGWHRLHWRAPSAIIDGWVRSSALLPVKRLEGAGAGVSIDGVEIEDAPGAPWLRLLRGPSLGESDCDPKRSWVRRTDLAFEAESAAGSRGGATRTCTGCGCVPSLNASTLDAEPFGRRPGIDRERDGRWGMGAKRSDDPTSELLEVQSP